MRARRIQLGIILFWLGTHAFSAESVSLLREHGFLRAAPGSEYLYYARSGPLRIYCRARGISIVAASPYDTLYRVHRIDLDFPNSALAITASQQRSELYHIVRSSMRYTAAAFEALRYTDVAPGVDLLLRWSPVQFKYDLVVRPGGRLDKFRFTVHGGRIQPHGDGAVHIRCGTESFLDAPPVAYQLRPDGSYVPVGVEYVVESDTTFGYRITSPADPTLPLVIDPEIVWSTYLGGSQEDAANDITTDGAGNIYVAGNSRSIDFPLRGTTTNRGRQNMIIAMFTPTGQHRWSTYFGGEQDEVAKAIAFDSRTNMLYVGGWSSSPSVILNQPYPNRAGGAFDAVVLAFTRDGEFVRGTFLGGSREELINALAVRADGSLIAVGRTNSADYPVAQALQPTLAGDNDVTITALSLPTLQVLWSTYYGGSAFDEAYGVTVSPGGSVFVTGVTVSSDFPTASAQQARAPALDNAFILALNSAGRRIWATYLGGSDYDLGNRIAYWNGLLFVAGTTSSADFPIQGDSIAQRTKSGYNDAFIACFAESGTLQWSTFWGGQLAESGFSVAVLSDGRVLLAGSTSSPDFPRRRSILSTPRGGDDIFVAFFREGRNLWSATFGGSGDDILYGMVLLPSQDVVGTGETRSRDLEPLVNPQYIASTSPINRSDCFLFRLCTFTPSVLASSPSLQLCLGQSLQLWASDSSEIATIRWNTGSTERRIIVSDAGEYWFTATSLNGCTAASDTVRITNAESQPVVLDTIGARARLPLCEGDSIGFTIRGRYRSHTWFDERGSILTTNDTLWVRSNLTFYALAQDTNGCTLRSQLHRVIVATRPILEYQQRIAGRTIPIAADTLTECAGTAIELDIARPPGSLCRWSDGVTVCQRTISAATSLFATVIDSNGCSWNLPKLTINFVDRTKPDLWAPDTVCTDAAVSANARGGPARWMIPTGLQIRSANADSSSITLVAVSAGTYRLQCWIDRSCSDTSELVITAIAPPRVRIQAPQTRLCPGQQSVLRAPSGFVSYLWNGIPGDSVLIVRDTGWYRLEIQDRFGCRGEDSLFLSSWMPVTTSQLRVDFGTVELGQSSIRTVTVSNPSDTAARLVLSFTAGIVFTLREPPSSTVDLPATESLDLQYEFSPTAEGDIEDTLIIVQTVPCAETLQVVLAGRGSRPTDQPLAVQFAIEDVTVSPLDSSVDIPIYAWTTMATSRDIDTLLLELSYNPTMLLPLGITPGQLTRGASVGNRARVAAIVPLDSLPRTPRSRAIATLHAAVLLGDREQDSLTLERAAASRPIVYENTAGIVRYTNLCRAGGVRLLGHIGAVPLVAAPNPSDGNAITLATPSENGVVTLEAFASDGRTVWHFQFDAKAGTTYAITLPLLAPGSYLLRMCTASGWSAATRLVVIR